MAIVANHAYYLDGMFVAILLGYLFKRMLWLRESWRAGIEVSVTRLLPVGIVLMGARLDANLIANVSSVTLFAMIAGLTVTVATTTFLGELMHMRRTSAILTGVGTAICGGSAILVAAPIVRAKESDTSLCISAVTICGVVAIPLFPFLGHQLGMAEDVFGIWAGLSIQMVPQVVAAGFAYGDIAGETAILAKMARVLMLVPAVLLLSTMSHLEGRRFQWKRIVPSFIVGFIFMGAFNSFGGFTYVPFLQASHIARLGSFFLMVAMVGVGAKTEFSCPKTGAKVLLLSIISSVLLATTTYFLLSPMSFST